MGFNLEKRDAMSLRNRWQKKLLPCMNRFVAIYKRIEEAKPSGTTESEWVTMACRQYQQQFSSPFNFVEQWQYLKDKGKFKVPQEVVLQDDPAVERDDGNQSVAVSQLGFSSVSSKKKGATNRIVAYTNNSRPLGRDFAKKLAKEELKIDAESSSFASAIPSLKSSIDEMTVAIKKKTEDKTALANHLKKQTEKQFKFDGYMKMADFFTKHDQEDKAQEFIEKAMTLMEEQDPDVDKKPKAKEDAKEIEDPVPLDSDTDSLATEELIENITGEKRMTETEKIMKVMKEYSFSQLEEEFKPFYDDPEDEDESLTFIPSTEFPQGHTHMVLEMDRGRSQDWSTWRTIHGREFHFVEEEDALEHDDTVKEDDTHSEPLLSGNEEEEEDEDDESPTNQLAV